jgi:hypothetical protein
MRAAPSPLLYLIIARTDNRPALTLTGRGVPSHREVYGDD